MPIKLAILALTLILAGWTLAAQPLNRANSQLVEQILKETANTRTVEARLMEEFAKPSPKVDVLKSSVDAAVKSMASIRKLLDEIDSRYDSLNETQRSLVREAWTTAELMGSYIEGQTDALAALKDAEQREDARVGALCAVRRADMLSETLRALAK